MFAFVFFFLWCHFFFSVLLWWYLLWCHFFLLNQRFFLFGRWPFSDLLAMKLSERIKIEQRTHLLFCVSHSSTPKSATLFLVLSMLEQCAKIIRFTFSFVLLVFFSWSNSFQLHEVVKKLVVKQFCSHILMSIFYCSNYCLLCDTQISWWNKHKVTKKHLLNLQKAYQELEEER